MDKLSDSKFIECPGCREKLVTQPKNCPFCGHELLKELAIPDQQEPRVAHWYQRVAALLESPRTARALFGTRWRRNEQHHAFRQMMREPSTVRDNEERAARRARNVVLGAIVGLAILLLVELFLILDASLDFTGRGEYASELAILTPIFGGPILVIGSILIVSFLGWFLRVLAGFLRP